MGARVDIVPPEGLDVVEESGYATSGLIAIESGSVHWEGDILAKGMAQARFETRLSRTLEPGPLPVVAALVDAAGISHELVTTLSVSTGHDVMFPLVFGSVASNARTGARRARGGPQQLPD